MAIATDAEILPVLERWARVRGFTLDADPVQHGLPWGFLLRDGEIVVWHWADDPLIEHVRSPALALAWALLVESDAGPVDVGRCLACVKRSPAGARKLTTREWAQNEHGKAATFATDGENTWDHAVHFRLMLDGRPTGLGRVHVWERPCPACNGTGRETIPAARLMLDAASGDAKTRDHLHQHADRRLAVGHSDGLALAWGLRWTDGDGERNGTGEGLMLLHWSATLKCPTCADARPGRCCRRHCGATIPLAEQTLRPDPYADDIHGDDSPHLQCSSCSFESLMDI